MSIFSWGGSILAGSTFFLCIILFFYSRIKLHRIWMIFNFVVGLWGVGAFILGKTGDPELALKIWRLVYLPISFIPVLNYHVVYELCKLKERKILLFAYFQALIFSLLALFSPQFITSVKFDFNSFYYDQAGPIYYVFLALWMFFVGYSHLRLFQVFLNSTGRLRTQILYFFLGTLVGFSGGATNFLPALGINFYPFGNFTIPLYCFIVSYAIMKHQLLDIKITVTRVGIFILVYSVVLGIPVWIGLKLLGKGLWLLPISLMALFATLGPFIYLYIQKRAEDRLLQEQRRYQATLRQASAGMGKIKDLKKLLDMIVYVLTHAIQVEHALVYVYEEDKKQYILGAYKKRYGVKQFLNNIEDKSPLIEYLLKDKSLIIYEEMKQKAQDFKDRKLSDIAQIISSIEGELIIPIFIDQTLIAIIAMGKKESGKPYTNEDISVFSILANQTALAIENAKFYEDMKVTHQQLFQAEKMATIGTMADGLSHQINNRFHALGFIAGDALDTIRMNEKEELTSEKTKKVLDELARAFVRVQENVTQGGEIVQGLLKYTRKGDTAFTAVDVDAVFKAALEMAQFKIKTHELKIIRDYDVATAPKIRGNFTQLQEVFFNLVDNAYDAMMQRKNEAHEASYQATLIVHVLKEDDYAQVIFEDNGMGVKDEDMRKLFTPFFTTKLSSKKGTGLGLYVIKKIVEDNHSGKVEMVSKYMQGTQMKLSLPIAMG